MKQCRLLLTKLFVSIAVIVLCVINVRGATRYVAQNGQTPSGGYLTWESAADNIQDAISAASSGDTIVVSNGVYDTGTVVVHEHLNRVNLNKSNLTLIALSDNPADTVIMGGGTLEDNPVRCVYVSGNSCTMAGFTLTNGNAVITGSSTLGGGGLLRDNTAQGTFVMSNCWVTGCSSATYGGGVHIQNFPATITHCNISNNSSGKRGGGVHAAIGTSQPCVVEYSEVFDNYATDNGGGVNGADIFDSVISGNCSLLNGGGASAGNVVRCHFYYNEALGTGSRGGGAVFCNRDGIVSECTIVSNTATSRGGATYFGIIKNSVIAYNSSNTSGACHYPALVENSHLHNNSSSGNGGAIVGTDGSVVAGCTFESNSAAGNGGAVQSVLLRDNCVVAYNTSGKDGGGAADSYAYDTQFLYNKAASYGGGLAATADYNECFASNCVFIGNEAVNGGGQYGITSEHRSIDCVFSNNFATTSGGGANKVIAERCLFVENRAFTEDSVTGSGGGMFSGTATNCRFIRNVCKKDGAGAYQPSRLVNCLFYGNHSHRYSGAVHGPSALLNCTAVSNTVASGNSGGAFLESVAATNCIVWGNLRLDTGGVNNWYTTRDDARYNHCLISPLPAGDRDEGGNINVDPEIVDVENMDFNLKRGSPCVNAGINVDWGIGDLDLEGKRRVFPPNGRVDMGALERIPEVLGTIINLQ